MTTGGCYCGAVRYRFEGGVMWPGLCHCAKCRAAVYNVNSMMPDMHVIAAGSPDDISVFAPQMRIYCGSAAPWALPKKEELPRFDAMPQKGGG